MTRIDSQLDLAIEARKDEGPRLREMVLEGLVGSLREKDLALVGHSHRVAFFADLLAHRLQLPDAEVERVRAAAFLHDFGKLGVSREILLKPGKLDRSQLHQMRRHPELGARTLQDLELPPSVVSGVLHHHEWWDGSGYPHGLAGERIPLSARIIAVCDAFDSMNSNRAYRKALPRVAVLEELKNFSGRQFEPALVGEFLLILDTGVCDPPLPFHSALGDEAQPATSAVPGTGLPQLGPGGSRTLLH